MSVCRGSYDGYLKVPVGRSGLIFWAAIRFENKCRDRTIGWLIFIDFRILTLSVSVKIPFSALKAIFSGLP